MSLAMTFNEFAILVNFVKNKRSPYAKGLLARHVKYIDPHFDMRTNDVFSITFRGFGDERQFHVCNECRDIKESLFERCMSWLEGKDVQ